VTVKSIETQIPAFKVPIFRGDTLDGDEYIMRVNPTFRSNAMSQFLEDPINCENSPYWLGAFASKLREYIVELYILSFLDTELDGEKIVPRCGL